MLNDGDLESLPILQHHDMEDTRHATFPAA
jgi:hypothetical protein